MPKTVLVAGATGRFGGICGLLLERDHQVRALSRDPTSASGLQLAKLGAEVARGDFDDAASLEAAMVGVDAVFATGSMHKAGLDGERRHGSNLAEAAKSSGVPHLIYVSGAGADAVTGVPVFEVKAEVERRIRALDLPYTLVAPVFLMENLFNPWNTAALHAGTLPSYMPPGRRLQQVPVIDVISFAALAVEEPQRFVGRRVEIASDELTAEEMGEILSGVTHRPHSVEQMSAGRLGPGLSTLFEWLDRKGFDVDLARLHREYPEVGWHSFAAWASEVFAPQAA
jgi:uncharacterized protein YbjT (DUF2867 family)